MVTQYQDPFAASDALFAQDIHGLLEPSAHVEIVDNSPPKTLSVSQLSPYRYGYQDGGKWNGAYGATKILFTDYWTLRARSVEMFEENLYGRGVVRRLVTSFINTGLRLEASPEEKLLGYEEDALTDWSEDVENRFALIEKEPALCDQCERLAFGQLQAEAYRTALVSGDVLCILRQHPVYQSPRIQLIPGEKIQTPLERAFNVPGQNKVVYGVEIDSQGRQVAYWVRQDDGTSRRLPAFGEKSGRRLAWLLYANDKRIDDVRGKPFLGLILQSLKEIDRYRDSVQLKATINAMLAMFIKSTEKGPQSRPFHRGAVKAGETIDIVDSLGNDRSFNVSTQMPGVVLDQLQPGEEPHGFQSNGTDDPVPDCVGKRDPSRDFDTELQLELLGEQSCQ
jgi:capsid protein